MAGQNKLTALKIKAAAPGDKLQDGGGLRLDRTEGGGKWIYRYSFSGRRREMGLGSMPDVTLADARRARTQWAAVLQSGLDPISERERIRAEESRRWTVTTPHSPKWSTPCSRRARRGCAATARAAVGCHRCASMSCPRSASGR